MRSYIVEFMNISRVLGLGGFRGRFSGVGVGYRMKRSLVREAFNLM